MTDGEVDRPTSVLLVDDEPAVLEALRRRLRSLRKQWNVVTASGGAAALDILEAQPIDVIVTDVRMPGMNGFALLERARALWPHALRIVLSGQMDSVDAGDLEVAKHCLAKPCDVKRIVALIEAPRGAAPSGG